MNEYNNRILIIDDDPGVRDSLKKILHPPQRPEILSQGAFLFEDSLPQDQEPAVAQDSYDLTVVENGEQGVDAAGHAFQDERPFAVAFVDMKMPGIDGAETARRILTIDTDIKVVILTAFSEYALDDVVQKIGKENIFYLRKPYTRDEIRQFARSLTYQWNLETDKKRLADKLRAANVQMKRYAADLSKSLLETRKEVEERRRVEAALKKSEEKYRTILESIEEGYLEVDLKGNAMFFNDSMIDMVGYTRDEFYGINYRKYADASTAKALAEIFGETFRTGKPVKGFDWELTPKSGDKKFVEASVSLIKDASGEKSGFRGIVRDVTERKLREIELRNTQEALAKARENEIDIASRIQRSLLLGRVPRGLSGFNVVELTIPSQKVDGDFYDFFKHNRNCFDLVVGDVMGKGVPAALLGAAMKSHFLRVLKDLIDHQSAEYPPEPRQIVERVQQGMIDRMEELETFVTLNYSRFDAVRKEMVFVDCGHMRVIHHHRQNQAVSLHEGVNMPLGFPEKEPFKQIAVPFQPGDLFCFYSDGITETRNPRGDMYGEKRLIEFIRKNAGLNNDRLVEALRSEVVLFSESETFEDDFTCVVVKIDSPSPAPAFSAEKRLDIDSDLKNLEKVRSFIKEFCENILEAQLDSARKDQLVLAVNEATTNIIKHGYKGRAGEKIQIAAKVSAGRLVVRLYDWGGVFDVNSVKKPKFDGSQEGGFGVYIISMSVDEVNYSRNADGRNCAELIINLKGEK